MPSGSLLVSRIAMTGILRRLASLIASCSLLVSMTKTRSGTPPMSLMPPSAFSSLSRSRDSIRRSFLVRPLAPSASCSSSLRRREIEAEMVFQLVSVPPSQRELTKYCAERLAASAIVLGRLTLGADEQHAAALGDRVRDDLQRLVQQRHGLREVDDVDASCGRRRCRAPSSGSSDATGGRNARPTSSSWRMVKSGRDTALSFPVEPRRIIAAGNPATGASPWSRTRKNPPVEWPRI